MSDREIDDAVQNLTSARKRFLHRLKQNALAFIDYYGAERCGLLTLTFRSDVTWKEASRRLNSLLTRLRRDGDIQSFIRVTGVSSRGRIHFHLLVALNHDIRSGFNSAAYRIWSRLNRSRSYRALSEAEDAEMRSAWGQVTPNASLKAYNGRWRAMLPRYGFGYGPRLVLTPILESPEQLAGYLVRNIREGFAGRQYPPGAQVIRYARNCPQRIASNKFAWNGPVSRDYRRKVAAFVRRIGCHDEVQVRQVFGTRWQYQFRSFIDDSSRLSAAQLAALHAQVNRHFGNAEQGTDESSAAAGRCFSPGGHTVSQLGNPATGMDRQSPGGTQP